MRIIPLLNSEGGRDLTHKACETHGISPEDLFDLIEAEVKKSRGMRRRQLFENFDEIFDRTSGNVD